MKSGKYALTWPVALKRRSSALLDQLPDGVAVRPDRHAALDRRVVGELRAPDDVEVPPREVLGLRRDLGHQRVLLRLLARPASSPPSALPSAINAFGSSLTPAPAALRDCSTVALAGT